ncbi:DUF6920 family protein [Polaromonas glacialis]|uniref:DUF6920 family protein n=1 Tax=Polaromonas glacialis TaxID=866564 RepID=UPI0004951B73|nr:DUF6544 family protein [Polaromonas glacialis]
MTWLLWLGLVLCVLTAAELGLAVVGAKRWANTTRALALRLEASRTDSKAQLPPATRYNAHELEGLPEPVQRYFRAVLKDGQPIIAAVTIELAGSFNLAAGGEQWKPFTSRQRVAVHRPGFLWNAKVSMLPGVTVRVIDSYIAGKGLLRAAVLGLFTVASVRGGGEIARGEFMRFLAEAPWYPTALLPSQGVRWEAVDEHSANATLTDGPLTLTLLFGFNDADMIDSVCAKARGAMVGKEVVMLPWESAMSNYQVRSSMTVPINGQAAWVRPEGRKPYFLGTITSLAYEFAE